MGKSGAPGGEDSTAVAAAAAGGLRGPARKAGWTQIRESGHALIRSVDFGWGDRGRGRFRIEGQAILP